MVIALIGGIGAGKSTVCGILEEKGFQVLKADDTAKELMTPGHVCYDRLKEAFGAAVLDADGRIDKAAYASRIYSDPAAREKSDSIVHPAVVEAFREYIDLKKAEGGAAVKIVLEAALPIPSFLELADEVWYVYADADIRISRLAAGRGYTAERCAQIIDSQLDEAAFSVLADCIIDNSGTEEDTRARIEELLQK